MEKCCDFVHALRSITWTRTAKTICIIPFTLLLMLVASFILLSIDQHGAVVSDSPSCAPVGKLMLKEGGSAVDAAIAMLLCEGVSMPSSAGIGGGFTAIIYSNGYFDSIVAGPTVPASLANVTAWDATFLDGAKSVGVPGELLGYWELHQKYGRLPWQRLFQPSIELCRQGVPVKHWLANILLHSSYKIDQSPTIDELIPIWEREQISKERGGKLFFPKLGRTLSVLAKEGAAAFYKGRLGRAFVADIQKGGGFLSMKDLRDYKVIWDNQPPIARLLSRYKVVTTPLPTYGAVTILILNIVRNLRMRQNQPLFWHKFVEASKHAFGHSSQLGDPLSDAHDRDAILSAYRKMLDPDFARQLRQLISDNATYDDPRYYGAASEISYAQGTANVCVVSPGGDIVAATTSLLSPFGAFYASNQTGIIANNLLRRFVNFDLGPLQILPSNRPVPGRQAIVPYSPTIVINDRSTPHFVISASGGAVAATLVATAVVKYVMNQRTASDAVHPDYLHNQLFPNRVEFGGEIAEEVLRFLRGVGHELVRRVTSYENYTSTVCIGMRGAEPDVEFSVRVGGSKERITPGSHLSKVFVILMSGLTLALVGALLYDVRVPIGVRPAFPVFQLK